jgi:hypothetical protein
MGSALPVGCGDVSEWKLRGPMPINRVEFCRSFSCPFQLSYASETAVTLLGPEVYPQHSVQVLVGFA